MIRTVLLCGKACEAERRLALAAHSLFLVLYSQRLSPHLPMELWLVIFEHLRIADFVGGLALAG